MSAKATVTNREARIDTWADDFHLSDVQDMFTKIVEPLRKAIVNDFSAWLEEALPEEISIIWPSERTAGMLQLYVSDRLVGRPFSVEFDLREILGELAGNYTDDTRLLDEWVRVLRSLADDIETDSTRIKAEG